MDSMAHCMIGKEIYEQIEVNQFEIKLKINE